MKKTNPNHTLTHLDVDRMEWRADRKRLDRLQFNSHPQAPPDSSRMLYVQTEYFTAGAQWQRIHGIWSCTQAAPIIHWMQGMTPGNAKIQLLKMGARWEWV